MAPMARATLTTTRLANQLVRKPKRTREKMSRPDVVGTEPIRSAGRHEGGCDRQIRVVRGELRTKIAKIVTAMGTAIAIQFGTDNGRTPDKRS